MPFSTKDIHEALHSLRAEGRSVDELEGLLIHTDDLLDLLQSLDEYQPGMSYDGLKLFGVKIIESRYAQKGTIFRIFKKDDKLYPQQPEYAGNYVIPKPDFQAIIPGSGSLDPYSDMIDVTSNDGSSGKVHIPGPYSYKQVPTVAEEKKEENKKQKRHSEKRKIELD